MCKKPKAKTYEAPTPAPAAAPVAAPGAEQSQNVIEAVEGTGATKQRKARGKRALMINTGGGQGVNI